MLLDRATTLISEIQHFDKLKASAKDAQALEARAKQLAPVAERLTEAATKLKSLREAGISTNFVPKEAESYGRRAEDLLERLRADPNSIATPEIDLRYQFVDRLNSIAAAADGAALSAWNEYILHNSDPAREEILAALAAVPDYAKIVFRIRAIHARIGALAASVPKDLTHAKESLRQLVEQHRDAWNEMTSGGLPDAVIGFLRSCSTDGARLDSFTEEVRDWLAARNLMRLFSIKLR